MIMLASTGLHMSIITTESYNIKTYTDCADIIRQLRPVRSLYAYHVAQIADNVQSFRQNFSGHCAWAMKANPAPEIVSAVIAAGIDEFDVASLAEIAIIHAANPHALLHFNHPVKAPEDIHAAWHHYGVRNFVVDCVAEVNKIATAIAPAALCDATLLVRFIDPRKTRGSEYNFDIKFGAVPELCNVILRYAHERGFKVGLAFHPGSQCENPQSYIDLIRCAWRIAHEAASHNIAITRLNLGGGWPVAYEGSHILSQDNYFRLVNAALQDVLQDWHPAPEIIAEPGRALVANACKLITRVELRREDLRLHINDGYYGGLIEQYFVSFQPSVQAYAPDGTLLPTDDCVDFSIFGPTCDGIDQLKHRYHLPRAIKTGDYIVFGTMGAYSNACATSFNGIPQAEFVAVERL
jgi:ornithine decarboxylase